MSLNPRKRRKLLQTFGMASLLVAVVALQWTWQALKFSRGGGIFYYISPTYGWLILTAIDVVILALLLWALSQDLRAN